MQMVWKLTQFIVQRKLLSSKTSLKRFLRNQKILRNGEILKIQRIKVALLSILTELLMVATGSTITRARHAYLRTFALGARPLEM